MLLLLDRNPGRNPTEGWNPLDPNLDQPSDDVDPIAAAHAQQAVNPIHPAFAPLDAAGKKVVVPNQ